MDPELIVNLYHDYVIPLTKEAEVQYLLRRLDHGIVAFHGMPSGIEERIVSAHFGAKDQVS